MADPIVQEKICPRCEVVKPAAEFCLNRARKDGLDVYCKSCKRECTKKRMANLSEEGKERQRETQRRYREKHLDEVRERQRKHKTTDKARAQYRERYAENPEKFREKTRRYRKQNREQRRAYFRRVYSDPEMRRRMRDCRFRREFGITVAEYEAMLEQQSGVCAICGEPPQKQFLSVDHDHQTGRVRALLCGTCNRALGLFKDSPELLESAKQYLLKYNQLRLVS